MNSLVKRSLALSACLVLAGFGFVAPSNAIGQERPERPGGQEEQPGQDRRAQLRERFRRQQRERSERDRKNSRNSDEVLSAFIKLATPVSESVASVIVEGKTIALGCIVSQDGEILTKASLLPSTDFECKLPDGRTVKAERVAEDKQFDLALLKVDASDLKPIYFADIEPAVGTLVTNASPEGKVLGMGMIVAKPTRITGTRSPTATVTSGFLGVAALPIEDGEGLRVGQVVARSAAQRAGIKVGDILMKVDEAELSQANDLRGRLSGKKPDDEITLLLKSADEEPRELKVKLGRRTGQQSAPAQDRWGGGPFSEVRGGFPMVMRHDSVIRPQDCGGPLVTSSGDVVGINIARALRVSCYAVPTSSVSKVLAKLRESAAVDTEAKPPTATDPAK
jgi:serine protease Do